MRKKGRKVLLLSILGPTFWTREQGEEWKRSASSGSRELAATKKAQGRTYEPSHCIFITKEAPSTSRWWAELSLAACLPACQFYKSQSIFQPSLFFRRIKTYFKATLHSFFQAKKKKEQNRNHFFGTTSKHPLIGSFANSYLLGKFVHSTVRVSEAF